MGGLRLKPEEQLCCQFMQLIGYSHAHKADGFTIYHVPNGQRAGDKKHLRILHAGIEKRMGVLRGVFDYTVIWKTDDGSAGMGYLEAKAGKNRLTVEQVEFQKTLDLIGIPNGVFRSPEEGIAILTEWGALHSIDGHPWIK